MTKRALFAAVVFAFGALAHAETVKKTYRADRRFAIGPGGTLVVENPVGNIEIIGGDGTDIEASTSTTITATSPAGIEEGHRRTESITGGDARSRLLKTVLPDEHPGWESSVDWTVKVPRSISVDVRSTTSNRIRVMNLAGDVHVKNFSGMVTIYNVLGNTQVDTANGSIAYSAPQITNGAVVLTSVNGHITASVPADADLQWVAETAKGQLRTNLPVRGGFDGNMYRGTINGPGGPTITTATLMGSIYLVANGSGISGAQAIKRPSTKQEVAPTPAMAAAIKQGEPFVGFFRYYTNVGDVQVPEIQGDVDIFTGAGRVSLGDVTGACKVFSRGGPLDFGDVAGVMEAVTQAGDITIDRARRGGTVSTRGGTIRVFYVNGAMRLMNGGGDILVRRTTAPINASTTSGDITVAVDRGSKTETVEAKTEKGNVIVHVPVNFSANVEATIYTADPDGDTIISDLPGLAITKEQIGGGKTRVHATGRFNGGGERLQLEATGGDIRITTAPGPQLPPKKR